MSEQKRAAFIGLGVMGYPMAGHLAAGGYPTTIYNRSEAKAARWAEQYGGAPTASPAAAADGADVVFICVGNDDDLRQVVLGTTGALSGMKPGAILIDHTTTSADVAREIAAAAAARGLGFLDAPVSGGQAGAENGALTIMVGGDEAHFAAARPFMECFGRTIMLMGPAGSGQLTKMVNQICIAGLVQALAEGLNFATRAGLDAGRAIDVISGGAAQSWQMENRAETMLAGKFDFGFAVDWMRKDLGICLDEANRNGALLPVTALVDQFYKQIQNKGGNRLDTSSLFLLLSQDSSSI
jgi:3-hydroxyisobutyrate dehydrogenase-like beta-hydroxyacid dehydrogenase